MMAKIEYYWHIHHDVLVEQTDNINERINYIKEWKNPLDIPLRLKLMTKVKNPRKLPKEWKDEEMKLEKAYKKLEKAGKEKDTIFSKLIKSNKLIDLKWEVAKWNWSEALEQLNIIIEKHRKVSEKYKSQLEALHKEEHPDCPWDGKSIFKNEEYYE